MRSPWRRVETRRPDSLILGKGDESGRGELSLRGGCLAGARTGIYTLELVATPMEFDSPALRCFYCTLAVLGTEYRDHTCRSTQMG